jgi:hypothetical protein
MTESAPKPTPKGDDSPPHICWFCQRPNPKGSRLIGSRLLGETRVAACAAGEGCNDGRIWHGPAAAPHYRDEPCKLCPGGATSAARPNRSPATTRRTPPDPPARNIRRPLGPL